MVEESYHQIAIHALEAMMQLTHGVTAVASLTMISKLARTVSNISFQSIICHFLYGFSIHLFYDSLYIFHIGEEYPDEYVIFSQVLCVNFGVSHSTMYKSEIEAKTICNSNKNCLGILQLDHSTTGRVFSNCQFPSKLKEKCQKLRNIAWLLEFIVQNNF